MACSPRTRSLRINEPVITRNNRVATFHPKLKVLLSVVPIILLIFVLTLSAVMISPKKPFWNDELYSYYPIAADFGTLMTAFQDQINNTPFVYLGLGWVWANVFGTSILSFRLFSSAAISASALITWLFLRRNFGCWPAAFGCLGVYATSAELLHQNVEARMYGLLVAVVALGVLLYDRLTFELKPSRRLILVNAFVHILIVHTHLFGLFYSGAIALAFVVTDVLQGESKIRNLIVRRRATYASILVAWFSFVLYLPAFLVQADAGKPYSWLPAPTLSDLLALLSQSGAVFVQPAVFLLVALLATVLSILPGSASGTKPSKDPRHLICLSLILVTLPIAIWVYSRLLRPIFVDRYMLPSAIGWAIVLAAAAWYLFGSEGRGWRQSSLIRRGSRAARVLILSGGCLYLLSEPLIHARQYSHSRRLPPGAHDHEMIGEYKSLPIVVQNSHGFMERQYYSPERKRYYYVLDWTSANTPASGRFGIQQEKHMAAWARVFPEEFGGQITQSDAFLARHDAFIVITTKDYTRECSVGMHGYPTEFLCPRWVAKRLLGNPEWTVKTLGSEERDTFLLVQRKRAQIPPAHDNTLRQVPSDQ